MIAHLCIAIMILLLLAAAMSDIAARVVPNRLSAALGVFGLCTQAQQRSIPLALLAAGIVFFIACACWRHGLMGGGDVKLLGAVSLLVRPASVPFLMLAIALAGGALGLCYWAMSHLFRWPTPAHSRARLARILRVEQYRIRRGFSLPYAAAIAAGTAYVITS